MSRLEYWKMPRVVRWVLTKRNGKQLLESLGRTLVHVIYKMRKGLIQYYKQVEEEMAIMYA